MGKIFQDATPEEEQEFIEERRKFAFLTASQRPLVWLSTANRHKRAADILYEIAHAAHEREMTRRQKEFERTKSEMKKQGLTSWSESTTLEGAELSDFLDSELLSEYLLLAGYALECILKGCLLAMKPELVENDIKLAKTLTTHRLVQLCRDCGITLSQLEQQVLDIITWQVKWRKYPVPKDLKNMPSPVEPNQRPLDIPGSPFHERKVQTLVDELYMRGYKLLEKLRQSNEKA
jgi:hypothetical protein